MCGREEPPVNADVTTSRTGALIVALSGATGGAVGVLRPSAA